MVYRDVNIALANELANYADSHGIDFEAVRAAANTDGETALLEPGIGVGGHCTPVYPYFMIHEARSRNKPARIAELGRVVNDAQVSHYLDKLGDLHGVRVAILGLAFRPQVKESAYSPAFPVQDELKKRGATVTLHDPLYSAEEITKHGFVPGLLEEAEVLVLNTAHDFYKTLSFGDLAQSGVKTVVDGRGLWTPKEVEAKRHKLHCQCQSCRPLTNRVARRKATPAPDAAPLSSPHRERCLPAARTCRRRSHHSTGRDPCDCRPQWSREDHPCRDLRRNRPARHRHDVHLQGQLTTYANRAVR